MMKHQLFLLGILCLCHVGGAKIDFWKGQSVDQNLFELEATRCLGETGQSVGDTHWRCLLARLFPDDPDQEVMAERRVEILRGNPNLKNIMRLFACSAGDRGTPVLETVKWEYQTEAPVCDSSASPTDQDSLPRFKHFGGYFPAGNDLAGPDDPLTVREAEQFCVKHSGCRGFTFQGDNSDVDATHVMYFKTNSANAVAANEWHSYTFKPPQQCYQPTEGLPKSQKYQVEIVKKNPLVFIVHDFATAAECDFMVQSTENQLARSTVDGGTGSDTSNYRTSRSANMWPDMDDMGHPLTQLTMRKFDLVRTMTHNQLYPEGQEPINAVVYDKGQQYEPHCDGHCHNSTYRQGKRLASSLVYCKTVPHDAGGGTTFTIMGVKIAPRPLDIMVFSHRQTITEGNLTTSNGPMSDLTEHSGCPVKSGQKWVATQWYREGVSEAHPWNTFENWGRSGQKG